MCKFACKISVNEVFLIIKCSVSKEIRSSVGKSA